MASKRPAVIQPKFDRRISTLAMPMSGGGSRLIKRGYMIWDKPIPGYSSRAVFHYLFNPSTVEASYSMAGDGVEASLLFPNAADTSDLRIPINQSASWSVLFDRTYELWGAYKDDGAPRDPNPPPGNNPKVVGVWADVMQLMEFTGMMTNYAAGNADANQRRAVQGLTSHQGILQMVPSWAYFGNEQNLHYYGYISEWDVTFTHWTQFMVPMRAVLNINFTMLPPPSKQVTSPGGGTWINPFPGTNPLPPPNPSPFTANTGRAGR